MEKEEYLRPPVVSFDWWRKGYYADLLISSFLARRIVRTPLQRLPGPPQTPARSANTRLASFRLRRDVQMNCFQFMVPMKCLQAKATPISCCRLLLGSTALTICTVCPFLCLPMPNGLHSNPSHPHTEDQTVVMLYTPHPQNEHRLALRVLYRG